VTVEALAHEAPLWLPTSSDALLQAAMDETRAHLAAELPDVCAAIGCSTRTLRRRFHDATGWTSFTRAFTRATGETPSAYRARARGYLRGSTRSKPA